MRKTVLIVTTFCGRSNVRRHINARHSTYIVVLAEGKNRSKRTANIEVNCKNTEVKPVQYFRNEFSHGLHYKNCGLSMCQSCKDYMPDKHQFHKMAEFNPNGENLQYVDQEVNSDGDVDGGDDVPLAREKYIRIVFDLETIRQEDDLKPILAVAVVETNLGKSYDFWSTLNAEGKVDDSNDCCVKLLKWLIDNESNNESWRGKEILLIAHNGYE